MFNSLGLQILNDRSKPTFVAIGGSSIVDLTVASESIVGCISGWHVCDEVECMSDHQ